MNCQPNNYVPIVTVKDSFTMKFLFVMECCLRRTFYQLVSSCEQVATILSILSSCNKYVKIRIVATCHLQTCCTLLKQLVASLWITSFYNQLATNLLTTCNRLVINKLSQTMRTHPDIGLLLVTSCCTISTNLLQLACI